MNNFLSLLEEANLIYRLHAAKEVLLQGVPRRRGDRRERPAPRPLPLLTQPELLGLTVETAFFKHLFTHYYQQNVGFSYWQSRETSSRRRRRVGRAIVPSKSNTQSAGPSELQGPA